MISHLSLSIHFLSKEIKTRLFQEENKIFPGGTLQSHQKENKDVGLLGKGGIHFSSICAQIQSINLLFLLIKRCIYMMLIEAHSRFLLSSLKQHKHKCTLLNEDAFPMKNYTGSPGILLDWVLTGRA